MGEASEWVYEWEWFKLSDNGAWWLNNGGESVEFSRMSRKPSRPDQETHHYNRQSPPGIFECEVHGETCTAETFVVYRSFEGIVGMAVCESAVPALIAELSIARGLRGVDKETSPFFQGTIYAKFAK